MKTKRRVYANFPINLHESIPDQNQESKFDCQAKCFHLKH